MVDVLSGYFGSWILAVSWCLFCKVKGGALVFLTFLAMTRAGLGNKRLFALFLVRESELVSSLLCLTLGLALCCFSKPTELLGRTWSNCSLAMLSPPKNLSLLLDLNFSCLFNSPVCRPLPLLYLYGCNLNDCLNACRFFHTVGMLKSSKYHFFPIPNKIYFGNK